MNMFNLGYPKIHHYGNSHILLTFPQKCVIYINIWPQRTWTLLRYSSSAGCVHTLCPWNIRISYGEGNTTSKLTQCIPNWTSHKSTSPIQTGRCGKYLGISWNILEDQQLNGYPQSHFMAINSSVLKPYGISWNLLDKPCSSSSRLHTETVKLHIAHRHGPGRYGSWSKRFRCPHLYLGPVRIPARIAVRVDSKRLHPWFVKMAAAIPASDLRSFYGYSPHIWSISIRLICGWHRRR